MQYHDYQGDHPSTAELEIQFNPGKINFDTCLLEREPEGVNLASWKGKQFIFGHHWCIQARK